MTDKNTLDLAREWAEWMHDNPDVYGGTSDRARAAADLISSLPDQWVDAEKLREVVADHHIDMSEELMEALGALLPVPPAPRTLADMRPEERAECEWMQCDHPQLEEPGVILHIWGNGCHVVSREGVVEAEALNHVTPRPDLPRLEWPGNEPEDDESDFDPSYTYSDKDEAVWRYYAPNRVWTCRDSRGWCVRADSVPPAEYGPYTRIEA